MITKGNELFLTFDETNIGMAFKLARECYKGRQNYELSSDSITIRFAHHSKPFKLSALLTNNIEFQAFWELFLLSNFDADLRPLDEEHYMVKMEDLAWIVRKGYQADIRTGPLLPYVHEPREYKLWFLNALKQGGVLRGRGCICGRLQR